MFRKLYDVLYNFAVITSFITEFSSLLACSIHMCYFIPTAVAVNHQKHFDKVLVDARVENRITSMQVVGVHPHGMLNGN